jgi:hypothetical protein
MKPFFDAGREQGKHIANIFEGAPEDLKKVCAVYREKHVLATYALEAQPHNEDIKDDRNFYLGLLAGADKDYAFLDYERKKHWWQR